MPHQPGQLISSAGHEARACGQGCRPVRQLAITVVHRPQDRRRTGGRAHHADYTADRGCRLRGADIHTHAVCRAGATGAQSACTSCYIMLVVMSCHVVICSVTSCHHAMSCGHLS